MRTITREDIAEIHEAIATRRAAQTEKEQKDQAWHAYAAKVIRENDLTFIGSSGFRPHPRPFTHFKHWSPTNS